MRIVINPSSLNHGIVDAEIRAVVTYSALTANLAARKLGAKPFLFIGPAADNEPWIEVMADLADPAVTHAFHAMMLRRSTVAALGRLADQISPEFARQRR